MNKRKLRAMGQLARRLRIDMEWSMGDVARATGLSVVQYSAFECGKCSLKAKHVEAIVGVLAPKDWKRPPRPPRPMGGLR